MTKLKALRVEALCQFCGDRFSHYASKPERYCEACRKAPREKICTRCGQTFTRRQKENVRKFLIREWCGSCPDDLIVYESFDEWLYRELIVDFRGSRLHRTPSDCLEEASQEACAYFVLYLFYRELSRYNDGTSFKDRLPSTQLYLSAILDYVRTINRILDRTYAGRRITPSLPGSWWKAEPTKEELVAIETEAL